MAPSSLDLGNSFNSFKTVTGRHRPDGNKCRPDGQQNTARICF
jgi:hypothetical protein